jgi:hypothetical protein
MMTLPGKDAYSPGVVLKGGNVQTGGGDIVGRDKDKVGQDKVGGDKYVIKTAFFAGGVSSRSGRSSALGHPPRLLPYLTNRTEQQRRLTSALQAQFDSGLNRAMTFFALGSEDECLDSFVEQVRYVRLPEILKSNGLPPDDIVFRSLQWAGSEIAGGVLQGEVANQLEAVIDQVNDALGVKTTADKSVLEQKLTNSPVTCIFHVGLSAPGWGPPHAELSSAFLRWLNALNLSAIRNPIVTLFSIIYPAGFFYRLFSERAMVSVRRDIRALAGDPEFGTAVNILPELRRVSFDDVEQWIREYVENVDREALRYYIRQHFSRPLGFGQKKLSMYKTAKLVKAALRNPSMQASVS